MQKEITYLKLRLVKQDGAGDRSILIMLKLQKRGDNKEGNKQTCIWGYPQDDPMNKKK